MTPHTAVLHCPHGGSLRTDQVGEEGPQRSRPDCVRCTAPSAGRATNLVRQLVGHAVLAGMQGARAPYCSASSISPPPSSKVWVSPSGPGLVVTESEAKGKQDGLGWPFPSESMSAPCAVNNLLHGGEG